ncbi:Crp/Fnr family transcriptional regulator [Streptomyces sp. NPDC057496]|uniref:Crp/Fnr family transcriptional regulator n=1 Tax=Streptomyces sp. NPDC057496 TaxID=3346149 RepID=UPI0036B05E48
MSEQVCISMAQALRDLVPVPNWEELVSFPRRSYPAGVTLLRQGDSGSHVIAMVSGLVKVVRGGSDGKERLLAFRGPGEVLGEAAVHGGGGRFAHVRTISECKASVIPADAFRDFIRRNNLAEELFKCSNSRMCEQVQVCEGGIDQRLAATLLRLIKISGARSLSLTRDELAQHLGVGRNSVTRALKRFGGDRVRYGRTHIEVFDEMYLRRLLGHQAGGNGGM